MLESGAIQAEFKLERKKELNSSISVRFTNTGPRGRHSGLGETQYIQGWKTEFPFK